SPGPRPEAAAPIPAAGRNGAAVGPSAEDSAQLVQRLQRAAPPGPGLRRGDGHRPLDDAIDDVLACLMQNLDDEAVRRERMVVEHLDPQIIAPRHLLDR